MSCGLFFGLDYTDLKMISPIKTRLKDFIDYRIIVCHDTKVLKINLNPVNPSGL